MDAALSRALNRIQEIKAEIASLERERVEAERFIADYERWSGTHVVRPGAVNHVENGTHRAARPVTNRRLSPTELADKAETLILENGAPMTRGQLAKRLEEHHIVLPGATPEDKARYLGTIMWRNNDRFGNFGNGQGYWPRHVSNEAFGYTPGK